MKSTRPSSRPVIVIAASAAGPRRGVRHLRQVRREAFRYVAGADAVAEYHSSPGVTRTFCRHCGSNLQWLGGNEDPTYTSIALGTPRLAAAIGSAAAYLRGFESRLVRHRRRPAARTPIHRPALARRGSTWTTDEVAAMLLNLFNEMRAAKVPVSVRELLDLIDALKHRVVFADMDEFYY